MLSQRTVMPAEASTITKEEEDIYKIVQKVRSVLDNSGELLSPDERAYLLNIADISFIGGQTQHDNNGAALLVFEWES